MSKPPTVIGVLTEPPAPSWWKANRHKVYLTAGLLIGYWIGTHLHAAPPQQDEDKPRPKHAAPATPGTYSTRQDLGLAS